jgi:type IV pilus assembly protein PilP
MTASALRTGRVLIATALAASLLLAGCASKDAELDRYIQKTKKQGGGTVEPLPEVKPYEGFAYAARDMRSPFMPGGSGSSSASALRPDSKRNREYLEQFSLDTLRMVGTLRLGGGNYALIQTKDGLVQRVLPGNYLGQNDGKVIDVAPTKITLIEIVPDGVGGYMERPASLALSE